MNTTTSFMEEWITKRKIRRCAAEMDRNDSGIRKERIAFSNRKKRFAKMLLEYPIPKLTIGEEFVSQICHQFNELLPQIWKAGLQ